MKSWHFCFLLFCLAFLKSVYFSMIGFGLVDEGESLHNARRILEGGLPYKDFFAIFPPMDNYFFSYIFRIFGESIFIPRLAMSIIFSFVPVLIFLICKKFSSFLYVAIPALLIIFLDLNIERLYIFLPLLTGIYFGLLGLEKGKKEWLLISGFLIGVASLIRFDISGAFGLAILLGIWIHNFYSDKSPLKKSFILTLCLAIGFLIPIFSMIGWLSLNGILPLFLESTFVNSTEITKLHDLPFPSIRGILPTNFSLEQFARSYVALFGYSIFLTYLFVGVVLFKNWSRLWQKSPSIGIFFLAGIFYLPYIFGRTDIGHMIKGGLSFLILLPFLLEKTRNLYIINKFILLLVISFFLANFIQSYWWIRFNNQEIYVNTHKIKINSFSIPGTTIPSANTIRDSINFLQRAKKDEPVLALPYMAGIYFLAERNTPTKFNNLLAGFITSQEEQEQFIEEVKRSGVKYVVYDPANGPKMKSRLLKDYNPLIDQYLMDNFFIVNRTEEGWLFMESKNGR